MQTTTESKIKISIGVTFFMVDFYINESRYLTVSENKFIKGNTHLPDCLMILKLNKCCVEITFSIIAIGCVTVISLNGIKLNCSSPQ
jgi:hypothetical protein